MSGFSETLKGDIDFLNRNFKKNLQSHPSYKRIIKLLELRVKEWE